VWTLSVIATLVNLLSLSATFSRLSLIPGLKLSVSATDYLAAFCLVIPITMLATAVYLAVGAFARDFKEGQNLLTPVMLGFILPLVITMAPGIELNAWLAFVPLINIALLIRSVFMGEWRPDMLFLVMTSSLCYAGVALMFATKVFERNHMLLGGKEGFGSVLDFKRRPGSRPTPGVSVLLFAFTLVAAFYGSLLLERRGITLTISVIQYGFFLLPVLALVFVKGYRARDTLALRLPRWRGAAGALLVGVSAWAVATGVTTYVLPPPESLVKALERVLMLDDASVPLWQVLLVMAVTPAICEELLFRGAILSGFRRLGMWPAILFTGFLFAVVHASIYRLIPTMILGVLMSYAVWRTGSILAGFLCHVLNNGLMVMLSRSPEWTERLGLAGVRELPWHYFAAGLAVTAAGVWLIRSAPPPPASPEQVQ
jgi:sodium transport system permease protein